VSAAQGSINSIFGFINSASGKDPNKLKYRSMLLPKHCAKVIRIKEKLNLLKKGLSLDEQDIITDLDDMFDKSLISTTSIKGYTTQTLTTNKSEVRISDPRIKKQIMGGLMRTGGQENAPPQ
jgi:hypothetical protein